MIKPPKFNPVLYLFYNELWQWIINGFPKHYAFDKQVALCATLDSWLYRRFNVVADEKLISEAHRLQAKLFYDNYGTPDFPFNEKPDGLYDECNSHEIFENVYRLAFIYTYQQRTSWQGPFW